MKSIKKTIRKSRVVRAVKPVHDKIRNSERVKKAVIAVQSFFWRMFGFPRKGLISSLVLLVIGAGFLAWLMQYRYFLNDNGRTWGWVATQFPVFLYTTFLVVIILLFFAALTKRPMINFGVLTAFIIALTFAHINKFQERGFPLLPEDLMLSTEAGSLVKFIDVGELIRTIAAAILCIALMIFCSRLVRRKLLTESERATKFSIKNFGVRVLVAALCVLVFMFATDFIRNHEGKRRQDVPFLSTQFVAWNQVENYDRNGFLIGFLYNMGSLRLTKPDGYTEEAMLEIHSEFSDIAGRENEERTDSGEEEITYIVILNESFIDPRLIAQFYPHEGGDITPNLHAIQQRYQSGIMYAPEYGGGTANIEFEVITGMTNFWANSVPYTDILPRRGAIPSFFSFMESMDYETTAIHSFNGSMYKRNIAMNNFGVDTFIDASGMKYTEKEGNSEYINDLSIYRELLRQLNSTKEKQAIMLMTMQNHLPFKDIYDTVDFTLIEEDMPRGDEVEQYFQLLHNSDKYLGFLIEELDKITDKKIALLFFGDHSPGIFRLTHGHEQKEVRDLAQMTPYFVYTNFGDIAEQDDLPMTTPNCLVNTMFNVINAKKPAFYYLLDRVCEDFPILTNVYFGDIAPMTTTTLKQYELYNYDILGGEKYWVSASP